MRKVYFVSDSIFSPMGIGTHRNFEEMRNGNTAIRAVHNADLSEKAFYAALIPDAEPADGLTRFEEIALRVARDAMASHVVDSKRTLFILSTTKGNVSQLNRQLPERLNLSESTKQIAARLGLEHAITVSNACISGVMAILIAQRFLSNGKFDHALVVGADEISRFIVSGFQSLFALSESPCTPFDKNRSGITLGEAGGAILLSTKPEMFHMTPQVAIVGKGAISNDANHISGPSRTGLELAHAIQTALESANLVSADVDLVAAHGTATVYNDEMEAKAFQSSNLSETPVHSVKGYFGHTLGAAGVVETIIAKQCLLNNTLLKSEGYTEPGVTANINVIAENQHQDIRVALKTASGFGGCNAAMVLAKVN